MWQASGRALLASFLDTGSAGHFLLALEGLTARPDYDDAVLRRVRATPERVTLYDLDRSDFLKEWLRREADHIPAALGGRLAEPLCKCPGGPFQPHYRHHRLPCPGYWFCKNASRWFRKVAAIQYAGAAYQLGSARAAYDFLLWVDSDCLVKRRVTERVFKDWLGPRAAVFYCKATRSALEAGVVGYHFARGATRVLGTMVERYMNGAYRRDRRWDDCYQLQRAMDLTRVASRDLATRVGDNSAVIPFSLIGPYIDHNKGRHGRGLGLMT
jgi:hypothetical protein